MGPSLTHPEIVAIHLSLPLERGKSSVAWDQGFATMKKGEKAILTYAPEYGYGENGSPPKNSGWGHVKI